MTGTRTERRVAILRAVMLGITEMFDDSETSEDGRGHLRENVEMILDHLIDAVYADAAFSVSVVSANAMTRMLYANARACYEHGWVQASVVLQRMACGIVSGATGVVHWAETGTIGRDDRQVFR